MFGIAIVENYNDPIEKTSWTKQKQKKHNC